MNKERWASWIWWLTPVISTFRRLRQEDLLLFLASLDYIVCSRHLELQKETWYSKIGKKKVEWTVRMQKQHSLEELGPNVKISDPPLWRLRQEDRKFEANLGTTLSQRESETWRPQHQ